MVSKLSRAICLMLFWRRVRAKVFQISVAGETYGPKGTTAQVGDTIQVMFTVGTASFTQSTLDEPCTPKEGGLDSGTIPLAPGAGPQEFPFQIKNSDPIFFFNFANEKTDKCTAGFVGTINASSQQAAQFLANAQSFVPGKVHTVVTTSSSSIVDSQTQATNSLTKIPSTTIRHSSIAISLSETHPTPSPTSLSSSSPTSLSSSSSTPLSSELSSPSGLSFSSPPSSETSPSGPVLPSSTSSGVDHPKTGLALSVVGALVAIVVFGLSVLAFFLYRRRRRVSRPKSSSSFGNLLESGSLRGPSPEMVRPGGFFSNTWRQRMEDLEEGRIPPFTVAPPHHDGRPVSNATTLVPEVFSARQNRQSEHFSESDHTYASVSVNVPKSLHKREHVS